MCVTLADERKVEETKGVNTAVDDFKNSAFQLLSMNCVAYLIQSVSALLGGVCLPLTSVLA